MIKVVLFLLLAMLQVLPAWAVNAPDYHSTIVKAYFNGYTDKWDIDPAAACAKAATAPTTTVFALIAGVDPLRTVAWDCRFVYKDGTMSAKLTAGGTFTCPYGGTVNYTGGMCTGVPAGGGPPPANPCKAGTQVTVTYQTGTFVPPAGYKTDPAKVPPINGSTDGTCEITIVDVKGCVGRADGFTYCTYVGEQTGTMRPPSTGVPAPSGSGGSGAGTPGDTQVPVPPFTGQPGGGCPAGTVQGGVGADGVPMCMGTGTNPPTPPKTPTTTTKPPTTTTGADGSTVKTEQSSQQNADGSTTTTTTTTTTAPDGSVTVKRDSVASAATSGAPGKTDSTPDQEQQNFCKQNPNLSVCRESSVSGSCAQTACVGDAIQCATLRAAATMQCKQQADEEALKASPMHVLGLAAANGNDPMASTLPTVKNASTVDMGKMDANGWLGGGAAFSDVSFTVQGKTFAVPLEKWTGYLVGLRYALMVVAMLVSFRMLSGVILKD